MPPKKSKSSSRKSRYSSSDCSCSDCYSSSCGESSCSCSDCDERPLQPKKKSKTGKPKSVRRMAFYGADCDPCKLKPTATKSTTAGIKKAKKC